MPARPAVLAAHGVLLAGLVAGTAAYVSADHAVTLDVDGRSSTVHTFARTVGGVLDQQGVKVEARDALSPGLDAPLSNGMTVTVVNARPVVLLVDGQRRVVWTTAQTVREFAASLGDRYTSAYLSASRSARIPLRGTAIGVRLPKTVTLVVDGRTEQIVTTAATWGDAIADAGFKLGPADKASIALGTPPQDGDVVRVTRVSARARFVNVPIPYQTVYRSDSSMYKGTSKVVRSGKKGVRRQTWRVVVINGTASKRTLLKSATLTKPISRIVAVGTRSRPVRHTTSSSSSSSTHSTSVSNLNWAALARCESGGNPRAVGGGGLYFGLYQFTVGTWHGVGGSGNPIDNSAAEQTYRAQLLYLSRGASPWPVCGRLLFS